MIIRRNYIDWAIMCFFFIMLSFIAIYKPDWFGIQGWMKYIWLFAVMMLLPWLYYLAVRRVFPDAFPKRIRIRPFINLHEDGSFNGLAVARLMELELQPQLPSAETKSRVRLESTTRQLKLSVAGATIPMEVILHKLNGWVFGPIHTVEGIISGNEEGIRLEAWSSESGGHWRAESSNNPGSDPLRTAIRELADEIKGEFGYYQELVEKYEAQNQYRMAIHFCQQLELDSRGATLGYLLLNAGRLDDAEKEFGKQLENDDTDIREDVTRGLGMVDVARGDYDDAINLFDEVHGKQQPHAVLDKVMAYCYKGDFGSAQRVLENLVSEIEVSLNKLLKMPRNSIEPEAVIGAFNKLDENDWIKAYDYLWILSDAYGVSGRCLLELEEVDAADEYFNLAIGVLWQRSMLVDQVYQVYLDLGARYEDLQLYSEAMVRYDNCLEDAGKQYLDDPMDITALTNLAWAATGNYACAMKMIRDDPLSNLVDQEVQDQVNHAAMILASLLINIPEDQWYSIVIGALEQLKDKSISDKLSIESIYELSADEMEQIASLTENIIELTEIHEVQHILDYVRLISKGYKNQALARHYFQIHMNESDRCHIAEAYFGQACIEAITLNYEFALVYLMYAISEAPELRNRTRLDEDLRVLNDTEDFHRLIAWP